MMNERGKSDRPVVPEKSSNKASTAAAERMEGRDLAKGNLQQQNASRTQCRKHDVPRALERVRERPEGVIPHKRHHLRQEPDAGNPLVRICAGGTEQSVSLPRPPLLEPSLHVSRCTAS
jgi:hypothetical protein